MTDERRPPAQAQPDDTAAVAPERPVRIVVSQDERAESRLEVVEATFEQSYHLRDAYSTTLFLAHFRGKGHLPYRRARQRDTTINVRAALSAHEGLWSSFLELDSFLATRLTEVTLAFARAQSAPKPG